MTLVLVTEQRNQPGASKGNRAVKGSKCQHCAPVILNNSQSQSRVRLVQFSTFAPAHTPRKHIHIVSQAPPWKHTMVPAERNTTGVSYKLQMLWWVWSSGFSTRHLCSTHKHVAKQNEVSAQACRSHQSNSQLHWARLSSWRRLVR